MAVMKNQKTGMWEVRTYYKDWTGTRRQKTKRGFAKKSETQECGTGKIGFGGGRADSRVCESAVRERKRRS